MTDKKTLPETPGSMLAVRMSDGTLVGAVSYKNDAADSRVRPIFWRIAGTETDLLLSPSTPDFWDHVTILYDAGNPHGEPGTPLASKEVRHGKPGSPLSWVNGLVDSQVTVTLETSTGKYGMTYDVLQVGAPNIGKALTRAILNHFDIPVLEAKLLEPVTGPHNDGKGWRNNDPAAPWNQPTDDGVAQRDLETAARSDAFTRVYKHRAFQPGDIVVDADGTQGKVLGHSLGDLGREQDANTMLNIEVSGNQAIHVRAGTLQHMEPHPHARIGYGDPHCAKCGQMRSATIHKPVKHGEPGHVPSYDCNECNAEADS